RLPAHPARPGCVAPSGHCTRPISRGRADWLGLFLHSPHAGLSRILLWLHAKYSPLHTTEDSRSASVKPYALLLLLFLVQTVCYAWNEPTGFRDIPFGAPFTTVKQAMMQLDKPFTLPSLKLDSKGGGTQGMSKTKKAKKPETVWHTVDCNDNVQWCHNIDDTI